MRVLFYLFFYLVSLLLTVCSASGQTRKGKTLTAADYHLWSTLNSEKISDYGHWLSYTLHYESGQDTLFVKSTKNSKTFAFAKGNNGQFIGEVQFGCLLPNQTFRLTNLTTGKASEIARIQEFVVVADGRYALLYGEDHTLMVLDLNGAIIDQIAHVNSYTMNPKENVLAYCVSDGEKGKVGLLGFDLTLHRTDVVNEVGRYYENVIWHSNSTSLVFVSRATTAKPMTADAVLFYRISNKKLYCYDTTTAKDWPKGFILASNFVTSIGISDDEKQVFLTIQKEAVAKPIAENDVQVWNAADKDLYSLRSVYDPQYNPRVALWLPEKSQLVVIATDEYPAVKITGNQQYALVYNSDTNKPTFKQEADIDYYLLDLATGTRQLFLKQQPGTMGNLFLSPEGNYIVYFREGQWWVYTVATQLHKAITTVEDKNFCDYMNAQTVNPACYGSLTWTKGDASIYIHDQFDVWEYTFAKSTLERLTRGREKQLVYRIEKEQKGNSEAVAYKESAVGSNDYLLLKINALNYINWGYCLLNPNRKIESLVSLPKRVFNLKKAKNNSSYIYSKEDFNEPTSLVYLKTNLESRTIFKSNPQHYNYNWGHSELIDYTNLKGENLQGVLYYPFDYDPNQKYPMLVNIYEKKTANLHYYCNPTMYYGSDFNVSVFTSKGYFVLQPDIVYKYQRPGFSATDCVVAATEKAILSASIDKKRMGLVGHSFGGYETSFIVTQTNIFAAALASAGIHDFISYGLTEEDAHISSNWRMEQFQMRMKKPFYEDFQGYLDNSPIYHAVNLKTPLLSYAGMKDLHVDAKQTYELYFALRRLHKEHIMLLYPDEQHILMQPKHQYDISVKTLEWFDYYLKGEPPADWINTRMK